MLEIIIDGALFDVLCEITFDDHEKARVWAGFTTPKGVPHEMLVGSTLRYKTAEPKFDQLKTGATNFPSREGTMDQAQRLLSRIKIQDLDHLDYRIVYFPGWLEALLIHNPNTDTSYAAMDVSMNERINNFEVRAESAALSGGVMCSKVSHSVLTLPRSVLGALIQRRYDFLRDCKLELTPCSLVPLCCGLSRCISY
jgi:hypothetical protein